MPVRNRGWMTATAAAALFALAGCGGGGGTSNDQTTVTPGGGGVSGRLESVGVGPSPGSVFIPRTNIFQIAWADAAPPPAEFTVALHRFKQPIGGESLDNGTQKVDVVRQTGSTYLWNVRRQNNDTLDQNGVYYLELNAPGFNSQRFAYIVAGNRSVAPTRAETIKPGSSGSLGGLTITPSPGSVFISKQATFQVAWLGTNPPPPEFTVALRRFKEPRGTDNGSDEEQKITVTQGTGFVWNIKRRDNFDLDRSGVYYLEVTAPGENPIRAAYIVSSDF